MSPSIQFPTMFPITAIAIVPCFVGILFVLSSLPHNKYQESSPEPQLPNLSFKLKTQHLIYHVSVRTEGGRIYVPVTPRVLEP